MMEVEWSQVNNHNCDGQNSDPISWHPQFLGLPRVRKKEDLTIACFLWGDWSGDWGTKYVNRLFNMVQRHLSLPHRFVCFTDLTGHEIEYIHHRIELLPMDVPNWRWNLRKMLLYKPDNGLTGRVLCFDLDVVITGSIDDLARYNGPFITCSSPFKRSKGKMGGSLIGFQAGYGESTLWNPLAYADKGEYRQLVKKTRRGSERMYYRMMLKNKEVDFWQERYPGQVLSYKKECKDGLPPGTRVVRFHGRPRNHEVVNDVQWVKENWR